MTKLSDTQTTILSSAAARNNGALLPIPESIRARGAALDRSLGALLKRGLVEQCKVRGDVQAWRTDEDGRRIGLAITAAGLEAIGVEPDTPTDEETTGVDAHSETAGTADPQRPTGKLAVVLETVERGAGATLAELTDRTGWQPHTTRAALTRLRQRGFPITLGIHDGRKAYRIADGAR